jgi:hypothetical protein
MVTSIPAGRRTEESRFSTGTATPIGDPDWHQVAALDYGQMRGG